MLLPPPTRAHAYHFNVDHNFVFSVIQHLKTCSLITHNNSYSSFAVGQTSLTNLTGMHTIKPEQLEYSIILTQ